MDDIDRTFEKLKRRPLGEVLKDLHDRGKCGVVIDPRTFKPVMIVKQEHLNGTGWNIDDLQPGVVNEARLDLELMQDNQAQPDTI